MSTTYRFYRELDHSKRQIRLVRPQGQQHNNIRLEISVFSLDDNPEYTALSYCWGSEAAVSPIAINDETFYVRPNLYAYLVLTHNTGVAAPSWLFVDAICINQDDPTERSHQVGIMGDVYRNAYLVEAWLGAHGTIHEEDIHLWSLFADLRRMHNDFASLSTPDLAMLAMRCWDAVKWIGPFCELDYWRRLWIVQEITLARALIFRYKTFYVYCGTLLDFFDLSSMGMELWQHLEDPTNEGHPFIFQAPRPPRPFTLAMTRNAESIPDLSSISTLVKLVRSESQRARNQGLSLHRVVTAFSSQNCLLTYDKIFGLLGMTASKMPANYQMPLHELYLRTLIQGLLEYESLQDAQEQIGSQWTNHNFEYVLARALGLDPLHASIFLLTEEVYRRVGVPRHVTGLWVFYFVTRLGDNPASNVLSALPMPKAVAIFLDKTVFRLRCGLVRLHLRLSKAIDSFLHIPGSKERYERYSSCLDEVDKLYIETYETLFPGSRIEFNRLHKDISGLEAVSQSEAQLIVQRISCLPTTREIANMFGHLCAQTQSRLSILASNGRTIEDLDAVYGFISLVYEAEQVLFQLKGFNTMLGSDERSKMQYKNCSNLVRMLSSELLRTPPHETMTTVGSQEMTEVLSELN